MKQHTAAALALVFVSVVLTGGLTWWRWHAVAASTPADQPLSGSASAVSTRGEGEARDAGLRRDGAAPAGAVATVTCDNAFVPSALHVTRTYDLRAAGRQFVVALALRDIRRDDEGVVLDWSAETRSGGADMAPMTMTTRCSPGGDAQVPWANLLEGFLGVKYEGQRFAIPAGARPGDQWGSDAVWRTPEGLIREVRHARATKREPCATPLGMRDCLRYEVDLTLSDETTRSDRAATTHAAGVEWISEGIGLVRSAIDDGSGHGPVLTLTAWSDP